MMTVDVRIERPNTGDRLYLHNGMWGPATRVLHAFGRACQIADPQQQVEHSGDQRGHDRSRRAPGPGLHRGSGLAAFWG